MKYLLSILLLVASISRSPAEDHTQDQIQSASGFSLAGVKVGMTMDQVKALGFAVDPDSKNNDSAGEVTAFQSTNVPNVDALEIKFFKSIVFEVSAIYLDKTVSDMGGWKTLYHRLTVKLGSSLESDDEIPSKKSASWSFHSVNRNFFLTLDDDGSCAVDFEDTEASKQIDALKESKAKVGF